MLLQSRIDVALAKALTQVAWRGVTDHALDALNAAYDRSILTVEHWLRGYDLQIGRAGSD